jgi:hypothetical protein
MTDRLACIARYEYKDTLDRVMNVYEAVIRSFGQLAVFSTPEPVKVDKAFSNLQAFMLGVVEKFTALDNSIDGTDSNVRNNISMMTRILRMPLESMGFMLEGDDKATLIDKDGTLTKAIENFTDMDKYKVPLIINFELLSLIHGIKPCESNGKLDDRNARATIVSALPLVVYSLTDPHTNSLDTIRYVNNKCREILDPFLHFVERYPSIYTNAHIINAIFRYKSAIDNHDISAFPTTKDLNNIMDGYNEAIELFFFTIDEIIRRSDSSVSDNGKAMRYIFELFGITNKTTSINKDDFDENMDKLTDEIYRIFKRSRNETINRDSASSKIGTSNKTKVVKQRFNKNKDTSENKLRDILTNRDKTYRRNDNTVGTEYIHIKIHKDED